LSTANKTLSRLANIFPGPVIEQPSHRTNCTKQYAYIRCSGADVHASGARDAAGIKVTIAGSFAVPSLAGGSRRVACFRSHYYTSSRIDSALSSQSIISLRGKFLQRILPALWCAHYRQCKTPIFRRLPITLTRPIRRSAYSRSWLWRSLCLKQRGRRALSQGACCIP
jgi:hypothetical protein